MFRFFDNADSNIMRRQRTAVFHRNVLHRKLTLPPRKIVSIGAWKNGRRDSRDKNVGVANALSTRRARNKALERLLLRIRQYARWQITVCYEWESCNCFFPSYVQHWRKSDPIISNSNKLLIADINLLNATCVESMSALWYLAKYHFVGFLCCVIECARTFTLERCHCYECDAFRTRSDGETCEFAYKQCALWNDWYRILAHHSTGSLGLMLLKILARLARNRHTRKYFDLHENELAALRRYLFASGNAPLVVPFALYAPRAQLSREIRTFIQRHDRDDEELHRYACKFFDRSFCFDRNDIHIFVPCEYLRHYSCDVSNNATSIPNSRCWRLPGVHSTPTMQALHLLAVARDIGYNTLDTCECVDRLQRVRAQTLNITRRHFQLDTLSGQAARRLFQTRGALALIELDCALPVCHATAIRRTTCKLLEYYFFNMFAHSDKLLPYLEEPRRK